MSRPHAIVLGLLLTGLMLALYILSTSQAWVLWRMPTPASSRLAMAILGDSDSHSYHDRLQLHPSKGQRGGPFNSSTWQWGELLSQLRPQQIDPGTWGTWGTWGKLGLVHDLLGLGGRAPAKEDFQFNFAQSGAGCEALIQGRMTSRLLYLMDHEPQRWAHGVVVIRIGVNDIGTEEALQALSVNPQDAAVQTLSRDCVAHIGQSVAMIHAHHPHTRIVLVGMFDNSHWAPLTHKWTSRRELDNIAAGLRPFNEGLLKLVRQDPRVAFFDDQAWFQQHWGSRDAQGQPAYHPVSLNARYVIDNTSGDHPRNGTLADGHAGVVWNLLWAQSLIALLNQQFQTGLTPLSPTEIVQFMDAHVGDAWQRP
jgi:hypothetical protein